MNENELAKKRLYYFNARYYDATIGRFINVDPIQDGLNWYVYCNNNPLSFKDPTGLNSALVNFRDMAGGNGHSSAFVQNSKGYWVSGDFGGQNGGSLDHIKGSISGEQGRYWKTETGTKDLTTAIKIVAGRFGTDADNVQAMEFTTDTKSDAKILSSINKNFEMYKGENAKNSPGYKLIGNSCMDSSMNSIREGGVGLPSHLAQPNLTYDTKLNNLETFKNNLINNITKFFKGEQLIQSKEHDFTSKKNNEVKQK